MASHTSVSVGRCIWKVSGSQKSIHKDIMKLKAFLSTLQASVAAMHALGLESGGDPGSVWIIQSGHGIKT